MDASARVGKNEMGGEEGGWPQLWHLVGGCSEWMSHQGSTKHRMEFIITLTESARTGNNPPAGALGLDYSSFFYLNSAVKFI